MELLDHAQVEPSAGGVGGFLGQEPDAKFLKGDKSSQMLVLTARLLLGVAARTRALENANYSCLLGQDRKTQISAKIKEVGEKWDSKLKGAIQRGEKITPAAPIHVIQWIAGVEALIGEVDPSAKSDLSSYVAKSKENLNDVCNECHYFRRLPCFKEGEFKILVKVRVGSTTEQAWFVMKRHLLARGFKVMSGIAPRNKKERELAKMLDDVTA